MHSADENRLRERILEENRRIHALENKLYLSRHPEQTNVYQNALLERSLDRFCEILQKPDAHILDLGCGTGYLYLRFLSRGYHMTGVDLSEDLICVLGEVIPPADQDRSRLVVSDALGFLDKESFEYDAVVLSALLHHLYDFGTLVKQTCAKLAPGGLFLIVFEPLKQKVNPSFRYSLHRVVAQVDEFFYKLEMMVRGIPLFEEDYELSDYQRKFGGIDPLHLEAIFKEEHMEIVSLEKYCARRYGLSAWIANSCLHTENTFNILARKKGDGRPKTEDRNHG